jgi:hypothetical protein
MESEIAAYTRNQNLTTPRSPENWPGTPLDLKGRFRNLNHPFEPSVLDVFRWKFQKSPFAARKKAEDFNLRIYKDVTWLAGDDDVIVWLGHSTFYIRLRGIQLPCTTVHSISRTNR